MRGLRRLLVLSGAALAALAATVSGCDDPFKHIEAVSVQGYLAADILPADRAVGSWRRTGNEGEVRRLTSRDFRQAFGEEALARARPWMPAEGASAVYRLGETGRTVTVEIYDLGKARGAFDVYSLMRERQLQHKASVTRLTKAGVQGMLSSMEFGGVHADGPFRKSYLLFWAERFLVLLAQRTGPATDTEASDEAALLAFAEVVTARLKQPFDLPEVYVLQIPGAAANSERYEPGRLWRRPELPGGVTARWTGRTGAGTLFISVADSPAEAAGRFERLRRAAGGNLTPNFAEGLFSGDLDGVGPVVCFRHGKAVAGLVGSAENEERLAAVEEIRKRCAGQISAPAGKAEAGKP